MTNRKQVQFWVAACFVMLFVGCKQGANVEYVEGKVTYNGNPVAGAAVTFTPAAGDAAAMSAFGTTDAAGVYRLTAQQNITYGEGKGTAAGAYVVTVSKMDGGYDENLVGKSAEEVAKADNLRNNGKYTPKMVPYGNKLPDKYKVPETSGFTVTVKKGQNKGVDFALTD
ncbi:MAG: carboxypeptidase-like regulatory domain-containing protein [Thermoguttaceae bacterium]